jgi:hypothetical protein
MMAKKSMPELKVPSAHDWRTTDADEINKRRLRARQEAFAITNQDAGHPIFSNFRVKSASGLTYSVEVRCLRQRHFACDCVDFRINGLGTCKHVEAVLLHLEARFKRLYLAAIQHGSTRTDVLPDAARGTLMAVAGNGALPPELGPWFGPDGRLLNGSPEEALEAVEALRQKGLPALRISQEVAPWLEGLRQVLERKELRRQYELKVRDGEWPVQETKVPLFPYQREGMLHLAFTERALLADEMGLGKTIQAIAACALLHRLGKVQRVLVVTPASLKTEWEEQIRQFTELPYRLVYGFRLKRLAAYQSAPFFTIVNYEQMVADALDVNEKLRPDVVVLDEAQRIKNWSTKTAQAIKRLRSRYAFVLTGTPIENRVDELHSLMDFLNPSALGPLFRFNRDFYELDDRGRPTGLRNLDQLHARIKPYLLRRRKTEVETELPERTDRNYFVRLSDRQADAYAPHARIVQRLLKIAEHRPLTKEEVEKLLREMAMMRMICDTNYILEPGDRTCPKLAELEKILDECRENDAKVLVFSEWERMLELVRERCEQHGFGYAWHTGSVPQQRRRAEINAFKTDPACRVFLSTDSGATGLNLQSASVVINCDLPWNPARLEQRIARAWRKHQTRAVTVINLISELTIEHRMLETLSLKQAVAESVLDKAGAVKEIKIRSGRQSFLERLRQLITPADALRAATAAPLKKPALPADPAEAFACRAREIINGAIVRCEERYPQTGLHSVLVVVVERDAAQWRDKLGSLHGEIFGPGKTDPLAPTQLEVIDRATDEALQRLIAAGLLTKTTRATRPLSPAGSADGPPPLTPEEQAKVKGFRDQAGYCLRMAQVLGSAGFEKETRANLLDAALYIARALALEGRLPEPAALTEALLPPLSHRWREALPVLSAYNNGFSSDWQPVNECLAKMGQGAGT